MRVFYLGELVDGHKLGVRRAAVLYVGPGGAPRHIVVVFALPLGPARVVLGILAGTGGGLLAGHLVAHRALRSYVLCLAPQLCLQLC